MTAALAPPSVDAYAPDRVRVEGREFWSVGWRVIRFIERNCRLTKGRWRNQPFVLEAWQKREIVKIFEVERQPDGRWLRRYRYVYLEVPKKNGKTELVAAINVYLLLADDEESPEIACGSNSDEQADLMFGAAKAMCELSPTLAPLVDCYAKEIVRKDNPAAVLMRVSAKAKTKDGLNLSGVTLDELHEFDEAGEQLYKVLTNGTAAREQPLILMITTSGFDKETLCGRLSEHAVRIISGEAADPAFYASVYTAPDPNVNIDDDAALEVQLRAANPSFGVTVFLPFYLDARRNGAANFKRYFLNIWTAAESQWLPDGAWEACAADEVAFDPALPVFIGLDASTKHDSSARVAVQWQGPTLVVAAKLWERPIDAATGLPVDSWRVPGGEIAEDLREWHRGFNLIAVGYDPAFITWLAADLEAEGLPMQEFPQTNSRMCPPTTAVYQLIVEGRLQHEHDPALARHIASAVEMTTLEGKTRLGKGKDRRGRSRRVDGAIALLMAAGLALGHEAATDYEPQIVVIGDEDEAA